MDGVIVANLDEHAEAILSVWLALKQEGFERHGRGLLPPEDAQAARCELLAGLKQVGAVVFLAFESDEVVGMAICQRMFSTFFYKCYLYVEDLWVRPDRRLQGIGSKLVSEIERYSAGVLGLRRVALDTTENNGGAKHFWERHGYLVTGPKMRKEW